MADTWLIVGLGNPGPRYELTRHNVGQLVVDELAARRGETFRAHKANARVAETWLRPGGAKLILAKPNTFMNVSGGPVAGLAKFYGVEPERVVVVHDELDIPFDTIKLKTGGGHGGHNGVRDVAKALGLRRVRARARRDRPPAGRQDPADWVLDPFGAAERKNLPILARRMPRMPSSSSSTRVCSPRSRSTTRRGPERARARRAQPPIARAAGRPSPTRPSERPARRDRRRRSGRGRRRRPRRCRSPRPRFLTIATMPWTSAQMPRTVPTQNATRRAAPIAHGREDRPVEVDVHRAQRDLAPGAEPDAVAGDRRRRSSRRRAASTASTSATTPSPIRRRRRASGGGVYGP